MINWKLDGVTINTVVGVGEGVAVGEGTDVGAALEAGAGVAVGRAVGIKRGAVAETVGIFLCEIAVGLGDNVEGNGRNRRLYIRESVTINNATATPQTNLNARLLSLCLFFTKLPRNIGATILATLAVVSARNAALNFAEALVKEISSGVFVLPV